MNILIACECSGRIREAFRRRGHHAWSNDLKPSEIEGNHIQGDCMEAINSEAWDLIILHPDCTAMAVSGNRWYGRSMPYAAQRTDAVAWTLELWRTATSTASHVMLENPNSVIFPHLRRAGADVQYVQPHMFGHAEFKNTGMALHGLPRLQATRQLDVPVRGTPEHRAWQKVWQMPPSDTRKTDRSRTYPGIADAIAAQWSDYLTTGRHL